MGDRPAGFDGAAYQARFDALAASGTDVHGEAALVWSYRGDGSFEVLDAGCGTGRVAIELARRGADVVGVDVDASMIAEARRRAPQLTWLEGDLAGLDLGRSFDVVVMAGNVPIFCPPDRRHQLVLSVAAHVRPGGRLIAGFQLDHRYELSSYDQSAAEAGLSLESRWSTWDREPFAGGDYAVSVHRAAASPAV
jgi:SAM-dependent methyltransferase